MKLRSLDSYSMIAYQCLKESRNERPTMGQILEELVNAFEHQASKKTPDIARVGPWGRKTGGPQNYWSFILENGHNLKKIVIDHGDIIYSLMITSACEGVVHDFEKAGGWNGGDTVSEVMFDEDEELIGINGTVGTYNGYTVISSISFFTNKSAHGPFGQATKSAFSVSWLNGSFSGFYGLAGYYIDGIGVYLKASEKIIWVGPWGRDSGDEPNRWSFKLEENHHLSKIIIDHGDLIYSLIFTTKYRGLYQESKKFGGWIGGDKVSEMGRRYVTWEMKGEEEVVPDRPVEFEELYFDKSTTSSRRHGPDWKGC
ncbi:hypothetical protein L2E82_11602 [Cichorium intybus]|uniref:Uncharacterized protein n=1 Tax=Cichorium intybus TaxID=13427 RepID=A0ACB9GD91_CICIN|nr:hypothetical protein L2E82_11602 [Cichorium intybus]